MVNNAICWVVLHCLDKNVIFVRKQYKTVTIDHFSAKKDSQFSTSNTNTLKILGHPDFIDLPKWESTAAKRAPKTTKWVL